MDRKGEGGKQRKSKEWNINELKWKEKEWERRKRDYNREDEMR